MRTHTRHRPASRHETADQAAKEPSLLLAAGNCRILEVSGRPGIFHKLKSILQIVDRGRTPPLLPVLRSQQQGEILALLLGDPDLELSLAEISRRTGAPHPSVYREVQRAEQAGLVTTRKVGNTRLVRANTASPYYAGLADVLTRAFGVPAVLAEALRHVSQVVPRQSSG